ncbi:MAG TPA: putative toxin-antitoxin system toxin component, PIN family [Verrucomicrobiae bacterium]|nr:putative toxin-antitoxin system toxin component, PIN family [Verrucomicrobiae bacterium]
MPRFRVVMDTNVLISALWSRRGASSELLRLLRLGHWRLLLSNHLLFEYEEVSKRCAADLQLTTDDIDHVLDALCADAEHHSLLTRWEPRLVDPDDEPIVQLAVEARADAIVTHNIRHLKPAEEFGIMVLLPRELLTTIEAKR